MSIINFGKFSILTSNSSSVLYFFSFCKKNFIPFEIDLQILGILFWFCLLVFLFSMMLQVFNGIFSGALILLSALLVWWSHQRPSSKKKKKKEFFIPVTMFLFIEFLFDSFLEFPCLCLHHLFFVACCQLFSIGVLHILISYFKFPVW